MVLKENDYTIKLFNSQDVREHFEDIARMQIDNTYVFHYPEKTTDEMYVRIKLKELKSHLNGGNTYFIAGLKSNKLCGFIWCYETLFIDEKRMIINSLYVNEEERGKGLSGKLMAEIKNLAVKMNCVNIATHYAVFNDMAGKFYTKSGFCPSRIEMLYKL